MDDSPKVTDGCECPHCGEARMDWLICDPLDSDTVHCTTCAESYSPFHDTVEAVRP